MVILMTLFFIFCTKFTHFFQFPVGPNEKFSGFYNHHHLQYCGLLVLQNCLCFLWERVVGPRQQCKYACYHCNPCTGLRLAVTIINVLFLVNFFMQTYNIM